MDSCLRRMSKGHEGRPSPDYHVGAHNVVGSHRHRLVDSKTTAPRRTTCPLRRSSSCLGCALLCASSVVFGQRHLCNARCRFWWGRPSPEIQIRSDMGRSRGPSAHVAWMDVAGLMALATATAR